MNAPTFISKYEFDCLCGGKATVGETVAGVPAVAHVLPYCKLFNDHEPTEYLRIINMAEPAPRGNA